MEVLCMCVCVWQWVEALLLNLHKTCQCVFVSPCRFPAELFNYQSLLFPGVCALGYTGIDVDIFVDVIMFLCMHVSLFFSLQPSSELMSERAIKRPCPRGYALMQSFQPCMWMTVSGCIHNHLFTWGWGWGRRGVGGGDPSRQYGWSIPLTGGSKVN